MKKVALLAAALVVALGVTASSATSAASETGITNRTITIGGTFPLTGPAAQTIALGVQHVVAMFGATFVFPIVMGLNPQLAIMLSGIATICDTVLILPSSFRLGRSITETSPSSSFSV